MKKILIVEDEPDVSEVLKCRIETLGHDVKSAGDGREAIDVIKKFKPDLIISDFLMPRMDGYEFYKHLKKHRATAKIPVMILTARDTMEDAFRIFGVDEFIPKPYDMTHLLSRMDVLLTYPQEDI